jgi:lysozyme family protein
MAKENFQITTDWLLVHEGGYVNHPKDPGGATNRGVIQRTYDAYRVRKGLDKRSVKLITNEEVWEIYKTQYWNPIAGDLLPSGLDYAVYDFSVNSGASRAIRFLQELLRVKVDGVIGNATLAAIQGHNNIEQLIKDLCEKRWNWMKTLKTFKTFGTGWTRRVMGDVIGAQPVNDHGVIDRGVKLFIGSITQADAPRQALLGKAEEEDETLTSITAHAVVDEGNVLKVAGGAIPGVLTGISMAPPGPIQWALAAVMVIAALAVVALLYRKFAVRS